MTVLGEMMSTSAGVAGRADYLPVAVVFAYFDNGNTHGVLAFACFFQTPVCRAVGKQQAVVEIFVVHGQEAVVGGFGTERQREKRHAVVVHTGL